MKPQPYDEVAVERDRLAAILKGLRAWLSMMQKTASWPMIEWAMSKVLAKLDELEKRALEPKEGA